MLFVKESVETLAIEYISHHDFEIIWNDSGSGASMDASYWAPVNIPDGYYYLGHFAKTGHSLNLDSDYTILIKPLVADSVSKPMYFEWIYDDYKTGSDWDVAILNPIPAPGYTCLGHVAIRAHRVPSVDEFPGLVCVASQYVVRAVAGEQTWNDRGSGGRHDFSSWRNIPAPDVDGLDVHTFVGHRSYDVPVSLSAQYVLQRSSCSSGIENIPSDDLYDLIRSYAPSVVYHPQENYMPDDAELVFNNSMMKYGVVKNENSYDDFSIEDANEIPASIILETVYPKIDKASVKRFLIDSNYIDTDIGQNVWLRIPDNLWGGNIHQGKAYVKVVLNENQPFTDLVFYLFYPYNGPGKYEYGCGAIEQRNQLSRAGRHQGDWEYFTLRLAKGSTYTAPKPVAIYLSMHSGGNWINYELLKRVDNRPAVFSAKDSHAMYASDGIHDYCRAKQMNIGICTAYVDLQDYCGWGAVLDVANKFVIVSDRSTIPRSITFDGRWGDYEKVSEDYPMNTGTYQTVESGPTGPTAKDSWSNPDVDEPVTC